MAAKQQIPRRLRPRPPGRPARPGPSVAARKTPARPSTSASAPKGAPTSPPARRREAATGGAAAHGAGRRGAAPARPAPARTSARDAAAAAGSALPRAPSARHRQGDRRHRRRLRPAHASFIADAAASAADPRAADPRRPRSATSLRQRAAHHPPVQRRRREPGRLAAAVSRASSGWAPCSPGTASACRAATRRGARQTGTVVLGSLRELLALRGLQPPYVLVAHSLGGLYANLFARLLSRRKWRACCCWKPRTRTTRGC